MANKTWFKTYREDIENRKLWQDQNAYRVLTWIRMRVDYKTGAIETGRFVAAEDCELKPTTFYQALKRLEKKHKKVTLTGDNKHTTITLVDWQKKPSSDDSSDDNKMTTRRQQDDTIQEVKNLRTTTPMNGEHVFVKQLLSIPNYPKTEKHLFNYFRQKLAVYQKGVIARAVEAYVDGKIDGDPLGKLPLKQLTTYIQVQDRSEKERKERSSANAKTGVSGVDSSKRGRYRKRG